MDCLENIIGLSDLNCDCVDPAPTGADISESGYFLTDPEHGIPLQVANTFGASNCFNGQSVWEFLDSMRAKGIKEFLSKLNMAIYEKMDSRFKVFSGHIGKQDASGTVGSNGNFRGGIFKTNRIRGGCWVIRNICLGLNCDALVDVYIYDKSNISTPLHTIQVQTIAGQFACLDLEEEILIPLGFDSCKSKEFIIGYELPENCSPLNNKFSCCSDKPAWRSYFSTSGLYGDSVESYKTTSYAQGISIDSYLKCDGLDWLCSIQDVNNYSMPDVVAKTIQFAATIKGISAINSLGIVSHAVTCSQESLWGRRNHLQKLFNQNIKWICENIPTDCTDCFKCKNNRGFKTRL